MPIRDEIRFTMVKEGFSIKKLSEISGVRRATISNFLNGRNIHLRNLMKVLVALNLEINLVKIEEPYFKERVGNVSEKELQNFCQKNRIECLALFGSVLESEFNDDSDIDVLIELKEKISFFELFEISQELKKLFSTDRKIDLVTKESLSELIRNQIKTEVLYEKAA